MSELYGFVCIEAIKRHRFNAIFSFHRQVYKKLLSEFICMSLIPININLNRVIT